MKKVLFILFNLLTITAMAQDKGRFEVYDLDNFKLHVYYTNDALGDASYIIEGTQELVTMPNSTATSPASANRSYGASQTTMWEEPATTPPSWRKGCRSLRKEKSTEA